MTYFIFQVLTNISPVCCLQHLKLMYREFPQFTNTGYFLLWPSFQKCLYVLQEVDGKRFGNILIDICLLLVKNSAHNIKRKWKSVKINVKTCYRMSHVGKESDNITMHNHHHWDLMNVDSILAKEHTKTFFVSASAFRHSASAARHWIGGNIPLKRFSV